MKRLFLAPLIFAVILAGCQQASAREDKSNGFDRGAANEKYATLQTERAKAVASQVGRWVVVPSKANESTMILDTVTGCVFGVQNRDGVPVIREPAIETSSQSLCRLGKPVATVSAK